MKRNISLKTKTVLLCICALVLLGFIITLIGLYYINTLKENIVKDALLLAEEQGKQISQEIHTLLANEKFDRPQDLRNLPTFNAKLEILIKRNENIVGAAFIDPDDNVVVAHYRRSPDDIKMLRPDSGYQIDLAGSAQTRWEILINRPGDVHRITLPIKKDEVQVGRLEYGVSESSIFRRISATSQLLTARIVAIGAILVFLVGIIFLLLWKMFSRHVALLQERDQLDKMAYVGTLASGLAHEIRNPLNAMNVNLSLIKEEIEEQPGEATKRHGRVIEALQKQIAQLNTTLTNFLRFALPAKIQLTEISLIELINDTLAVLEPEMRQKGVRYTLHSPETCSIVANPDALRQVLMNVLINAVQAMTRTEKRIDINVEVHDKNCRISITDTGEGIPEGELEKIFDVFQSTKPGGSGFGLAIARRVVTDHRGKIWAENVDGAGARIIIELPMNPTTD
jgi:signal transduction histidine kinase